MSVYYNKKLISGVRDVPQMTLAEYNALTNKPDLWLRTDAPESDRGISASDVEYSTGVSVEDKIDEITSYSTTEKIVGTWIDGKPIYQKTIDCGALPNNALKGTNHNISNLKKVISIKGSASASSGAYIPLPHTYFSSNSILTVQVNVTNSEIRMTTKEDLSIFTESYITLEYTKTTD